MLVSSVVEELFDFPGGRASAFHLLWAEFGKENVLELLGAEHAGCGTYRLDDRAPSTASATCFAWGLRYVSGEPGAVSLSFCTGSFSTCGAGYDDIIGEPHDLNEPEQQLTSHMRILGESVYQI